MEELEKKTRKSSSAKSTTSKASATKTTQKTTKKATATSTEKKPKSDKVNISKTTKKVASKKEEKDSKPTVEEKIIRKAEKKSRTTTAKIKVGEKEENASKEPIEKVSVTRNKNTVTKINTKETKEKVNNSKETKKVIATKNNKEPKKPEKIVQKNETLKESNVKKEQQKEDEEKSKKYIEISIGGIIAVLLIIILIVLNITLGKKAYNITKGNNTTQNNVVDTDAEVEETIGTVLNNQNPTVNKLIKKIVFPINTTASIYQIGTFDENTIPDDLKLRIGWANLKEESKFHAKQATGESIIVVEKNAMQESIQEIFGKQVKYKDVTFDNTNVTEFSGYAETEGIINYEGETYTGIINEDIVEDRVAFIYQEVQKVIKYDNEIVIIMKTAFVNQEDDKYVIYQNYNDNFENRLLETTYEKLFENSVFNKKTGEGSISISNNKVLNEIRNELNTYKYTFTKDDFTEEYYLKEFEKENLNG